MKHKLSKNGVLIIVTEISELSLVDFTVEITTVVNDQDNDLFETLGFENSKNCLRDIEYLSGLDKIYAKNPGLAAEDLVAQEYTRVAAVWNLDYKTYC